MMPEVVGLVAPLAALLGVYYVAQQLRRSRVEASMSSYDLAVRQLIDFKSSFPPQLLTKQNFVLPENGDPDGDALRASLAGVPPGMLISEFLHFARGYWVFSFVFGVAMEQQVDLTPAERNGLLREICLWLAAVPGFRLVWETHTRPNEVHNEAYRDWIAKQVLVDDRRTVVEVLAELEVVASPRWRSRSVRRTVRTRPPVRTISKSVTASVGSDRHAPDTDRHVEFGEGGSPP